MCVYVDCSFSLSVFCSVFTLTCQRRSNSLDAGQIYVGLVSGNWGQSWMLESFSVYTQCFKGVAVSVNSPSCVRTTLCLRSMQSWPHQRGLVTTAHSAGGCGWLCVSYPSQTRSTCAGDLSGPPSLPVGVEKLPGARPRPSAAPPAVKELCRPRLGPQISTLGWIFRSKQKLDLICGRTPY